MCRPIGHNRGFHDSNWVGDFVYNKFIGTMSGRHDSNWVLGWDIADQCSTSISGLSAEMITSVEGL